MNLLHDLSVSTVAYNGYPFETACAEVARLGVRFVEPLLIPHYDRSVTEELFTWEGGEEWKRVAESHGLVIRSVGVHFDVAGPGADGALARRIEFASGVGARYLHTNLCSPVQADECLAVLQRGAVAAADRNIVICLENPGEPAVPPYGTGTLGAPFIRAVARANVLFNYDPSNIFSHTSGQVRPEDDVGAAVPLLAHLHIKDLAPEGDHWCFSVIGEGLIDYCRLLHDVRRILTVPMSLELPLGFERGPDFRMRRRRTRPPLGEIADALGRSLAHLDRGDTMGSAKGADETHPFTTPPRHDRQGVHPVTT